MHVCGDRWWGVAAVSGSDMRGSGDDIAVIPLFVSGLRINFQHSLPEDRYAKNTVPLWARNIRAPKF